MSLPTLVLDANSVSAPGFGHWIRGYAGRKVLPLVAYVELGVLHAGRGRRDKFRSFLAAAGVEVEWMRVPEAEAAVDSAVQVGDFARNARDHLIGSHAVAPDRILVTNNVRDFSFLPRVLSPEDAMRKYPRRSP